MYIYVYICCCCGARSCTDTQPIRPLARPYWASHRVGRQVPGETLGQHSVTPYYVQYFHMCRPRSCGQWSAAHEPTNRPAPPAAGDTRIVASGGTGAATGAGEVGARLPALPSFVGSASRPSSSCSSSSFSSSSCSSFSASSSSLVTGPS